MNDNKLNVITTNKEAIEQMAWTSFCAARQREGLDADREIFERLVKKKKIPLCYLTDSTLFKVGLIAYVTALEGHTSRREAVRRYLEDGGCDTDPAKFDAACMMASREITKRNRLT